MSLLLSIYLFVGLAFHSHCASLDCVLWTGAILCAALTFSRRDSLGPLITTVTASTAVLLGSIALVAP